VALRDISGDQSSKSKKRIDTSSFFNFPKIEITNLIKNLAFSTIRQNSNKPQK